MAEESYSDALSRVQSTGTLWLNSVFAFNNGSIWLFRRVRITKIELIWFFLVFFLWMLVGMGLYFLIGDFWPFDVLLMPFIIPIEAFILGWVLGRRFAVMSPLRRRTGENTGVWVLIMMRRIVVRISGMFGGAITYNYCVTKVHGNGRSDVVQCIEWLGTARVPRAPRVLPGMLNVDEHGYGEASVFNPPRGIAKPRNFIQK